MSDGRAEGRRLETDVEISPEKAKEWLAKSGGNRQLKQNSIRLLTDEIMGGRWIRGASTIRISRSGVLLDGHHRLTAIVRSGKTVLCDVMYDCDDESMLAIDVGTARSAADINVIRGRTNSIVICSVINSVRMAYTVSSRKISIQEIDLIENAMRPILAKDIVRLHRECKLHRLYRPSLTLGALLFFQRTEPELEGFVADVASCSGRAGDPSKTTSDYLLRLSATKTTHEYNALYTRLAAGASAYLRGTQLSAIRENFEALASIRKKADEWWPKEVT